MKFSIKAALICFLSLLPQAFAGGGSLVGNGAGLAELEITYAYIRLPEMIRSCFENKDCNLNGGEEEVLRRELAVLKAYPNPVLKVQFVSETEKPGFFDTGVNEFHRIAKTEMRDNSVIFINRDALYRNGKAVVDMPTGVSILIHELGHQVGIPDHTWLDTLGGKIRATLEKTKLKVDHPQTAITMDIYNGIHSFGFFVYNPESSVDLTSRAESAIACPKNTKLSEAAILNPHWDSAPTWSIYQFSAFVRYACHSPRGEMEKLLVEISFYIPADAAEGKVPMTQESISFTVLQVRK